MYTLTIAITYNTNIDISVRLADESHNWWLRGPGLGWESKGFGAVMWGDHGLDGHAAFSDGFANPRE